MRKLVRWAAWSLALVVLLLAGSAAALHFWINGADFRSRAEREAATALGMPVQLGRIAVDLWPLPAVGLDDVRIQSQPPLTLQRVEARPAWAALLQGRLEIATLVVRNAVVPQQAVAAIGALQKKDGPKGATSAPPKAGAMTFLPRRTVLDHVSWVDAQGVQTTVDAVADLDADGLPGSASVKVLQGRLQGAQARLKRQPEHWVLQVEVGGGTVKGSFNLKPAGKDSRMLQGVFDTANVEVSALTAPSRSLTGKLEAHTSVRAQFSDPAALADVLRSETRFTVRNAVVHGIDLAQAVKTVGLTRAGETRLDTLTGQVVTQGRAIQLNNLMARSGVLAANGNVAVATNRSLSGRVTVDLLSSAVGGAVGVPLVVGGTVDSPSVTLSRGALVGAAIGTVVAPGAGTAAGAKLGDRATETVRGLFGK